MQNTATITICVWKLKLLRMETLIGIRYNGRFRSKWSVRYFDPNNEHPVFYF